MAKEKAREVEKPFEKPVEKVDAPVKGFSVEDKIKEIESSRLPDSAKGAYIDELKKKKEDVEAVTLDVYLRIKKIADSKQPGMRAYPKARAIVKAAVADWDKVFANY